MRQHDLWLRKISASNTSLCPRCDSPVYLAIAYPLGVSGGLRVRTLRCTSPFCLWKYVKQLPISA